MRVFRLHAMRTFAVAAGLTLSLLAPLAGQQTDPAPAADRDEQLRTFRMVRRVDLVQTPLVVQTHDGEYVDNLLRDEIEIYDKGERQILTDFEISEQPLSIAVVFDTSTRIKPLLERVQKTAFVFTESIIGPYGEAAVIGFDDEVRILQDFTPDADRILETVQGLKAQGSLTRLADAMHMAVERLLARPLGRRRVIILVSEERDEGSEADLGEALRLAQLGDISIYTVALSKAQADWLRRPQDTTVQESVYPPGTFPTPPVPGTIETPTMQDAQMLGRANLLGAIETLIRAGRSTIQSTLLETYSGGTVGLNYEPRGQDDLDVALYEIGQDIRSQYLLSYRPSNGSEQGFHEIEVRVLRGKVRTRYRPGYYIGVPPEG